MCLLVLDRVCALLFAPLLPACSIALLVSPVLPAAWRFPSLSRAFRRLRFLALFHFHFVVYCTAQHCSHPHTHLLRRAPYPIHLPLPRPAPRRRVEPERGVVGVASYLIAALAPPARRLGPAPRLRLHARTWYSTHPTHAAPIIIRLLNCYAIRPCTPATLYATSRYGLYTPRLCPYACAIFFTIFDLRLSAPTLVTMFIYYIENAC